MNTEEKRGRGRPRADYKCSITGRVCPFSWEYFYYDGGSAKYECPINQYEDNNHRSADGVALVLDDTCKHAIARFSD